MMDLICSKTDNTFFDFVISIRWLCASKPVQMSLKFNWSFIVKLRVCYREKQKKNEYKLHTCDVFSSPDNNSIGRKFQRGCHFPREIDLSLKEKTTTLDESKNVSSAHFITSNDLTSKSPCHHLLWNIWSTLNRGFATGHRRCARFSKSINTNPRCHHLTFTKI